MVKELFFASFTLFDTFSIPYIPMIMGGRVVEKEATQIHTPPPHQGSTLSEQPEGV